MEEVGSADATFLVEVKPNKISRMKLLKNGNKNVMKNTKKITEEQL